MLQNTPKILLIISLVAGLCNIADAQNRRSGVSFAGERATSIQNKTVPMDRANLGGQRSNLTDQRFGIEEWRKQFSPIGQRRSGLGSRESRLGNQRFDYDRVDMPEKVFGMARVNEKMANLRDEAQISSDDRAWKFDRAPNSMVDLQNMSRFVDMGEELDLQAINRYQFRRNRSEGVPVQPAGR